MKKIVLAALAATSALIAMPASAQTTTGTVTINGSVANKCQVVPTAGDPSATYAPAAISLGELSQANGLLKTGLATTLNANSALSFRVICNSGSTAVTVRANSITASTEAPDGYANHIRYAAKATFSLVASGTQDVSNDSAAAAQTSTTLTNRLATSGNNVTITTSDFRTPNPTDVLVANNNYQGTIVVTLTAN